MNLSNNKILITGGGSGIGLGLAKQFLAENNTVIVCGRRASVLAELTEQYPAIITRVCDLSVSSEREALYQWILTERSDLNVLVNNAGIQQWMDIADPDFYLRAKEELAINIEAPLHLTALFIKLSNLTTVINTTSGLSFTPLAKVSTYSASKAYFHSFTLSLRALLAPRNIEVIELIPPAINTDLGGKGIHDAAPPVSEFIPAIFAQLKAGKTELTYGFSEAMTKAGPVELQAAFNRMNGTDFQVK